MIRWMRRRRRKMAEKLPVVVVTEQMGEELPQETMQAELKNVVDELKSKMKADKKTSYKC